MEYTVISLKEYIWNRSYGIIFICKIGSYEESIYDSLDGLSQTDIHWDLLVNKRTGLGVLIGTSEIFR